RLATSGHEVRVIMSAPVWVLPCRVMTSGAGLVSGNCAVNVRVTPLILTCSGNAALAQNTSAAPSAKLRNPAVLNMEALRACEWRGLNGWVPLHHGWNFEAIAAV